MIVEHYIPKTVEEIFSKYKFSLVGHEVKYPKCISYNALVSDEIMVVYLIYVDDIPRFFGIYELDFDPEDQAHTNEIFKSWSESSDIKLIETIYEGNHCHLYELTEPFGIQFTD